MTDILSSPSVAPVSLRERSTWRPLPGRAPAVENLPQAPADEDKFAYFGSQHIWFITARTLAACSAATLIRSSVSPRLFAGASGAGGGAFGGSGFAAAGGAGAFGGAAGWGAGRRAGASVGGAAPACATGTSHSEVPWSSLRLPCASK